MKMLALDTSSRVLKLAAFDGNNCVLERSLEALMRQNESLAPLFSATLESLGWKASELGMLAVSLGPGSFTGLRTGLAFAKGICFATGAKLVGIPTLEAWAEASKKPETLVWLDARRGMVYRGWYKEGKPVCPSAMIPLEQAREEQTAEAARVGDLPDMEGSCGADAVGRLALRRLAAGLLDDPATLEPLYLRRAEAEILWEQRHGV